MGKQTRENILAMSHKLFMEQGYEQTKVETICAAAGTAKGSFFYYFDKKEHVVETLLDQQITGMSNHLKALLKSMPSPADQMSALMSLLLLNRQTGPPALHYFKEGLPNWFDLIAHQKRDGLILPIIQDVVSKGRDMGMFHQTCTDQVTEITYLGISQLVHLHYEAFDDPNYLTTSIESFEYILNTILGTAPKQIKISPKYLPNMNMIPMEATK